MVLWRCGLFQKTDSITECFCAYAVDYIHIGAWSGAILSFQILHGAVTRKALSVCKPIISLRGYVCHLCAFHLIRTMPRDTSRRLASDPHLVYRSARSLNWITRSMQRMSLHVHILRGFHSRLGTTTYL